MSDLESLAVESRESLGKRASRRLRRDGFIPAVLYGHQQESVNLRIPARGLEAALRHHARGVKLTGAVDAEAVIQEIQYNTFGNEVLHLDLLRVKSGDRVSQVLPLHLHGQAPGLSEGGQIDVAIHDIPVICDPLNIPDHLSVDVNGLHVGVALMVKDIVLPPGVEIDLEPETVVVQCKKPGGGGGAADEEAEGGEPAKSEAAS